MPMNTCPSCGHQLSPTARFCGGCGSSVQPMSAPPPTPQASQLPPTPKAPLPAWPQAQVQHPPSSPPQARPVPASHQPADAPIERIHCQWCQAMNEKTAVSCRTCGAPLDIKNLVSESGWREAPRIKDMTEIRFGQSSCQVEGEIVPVAEINLGQNDSI